MYIDAKHAGRQAVNLEEKRKLGGGYNFLLQTSLPEKLRVYNPAEETADSSHVAFTTAFPRGFAVEILQVYSGPPVIVYKFRHWGYMEGPFKGHAPTGEMVELFGIGIFEVSSCTFLFFLFFSQELSIIMIHDHLSFFIWNLFSCLKQLDEQEKIIKIEFFFDRGELLGGLLRGASLDSSTEAAVSTCPILRNTG